MSVERSFSRAEADELMAKGEKLGIMVSFWSVTNKYATDSISNLCPWPFERAYVSSDLRVMPCCIIANSDVFEVGVLDKHFTSVWKGEKMTRFREARLKGEIPQICSFCYKNEKRAKAS